MAEPSEKSLDLDEGIQELEVNLKRLKVEYEQYFMKILKREPLFLRQKIDRTILFYTLQHIQNTALKFKFRNLVDQYNVLKQYWNRSVRAIENGTFRRGPGATKGAPTLKLTTPSAAAAKAEEPSAGGKAGPQDKGLKALYKSYITAKKRCNEPTDHITFDALRQTLIQQQKAATDKFGTDKVIFGVKTVKGKTKLVVKKKKP